jgi:hypothetical protein
LMPALVFTFPLWTVLGKWRWRAPPCQDFIPVVLSLLLSFTTDNPKGVCTHIRSEELVWTCRIPQRPYYRLVLHKGAVGRWWICGTWALPFSPSQPRCAASACPKWQG